MDGFKWFGVYPHECIHITTRLHEVAKNLGSVSEGSGWDRFAPLTNAEPVLVQKNLSASELVWWQKRAFREFYLRPWYIIKKIRLHLSVDGIKTLFEGLRILLRIQGKKSG